MYSYLERKEGQGQTFGPHPVLIFERHATVQENIELARGHTQPAPRYSTHEEAFSLFPTAGSSSHVGSVGTPPTNATRAPHLPKKSPRVPLGSFVPADVHVPSGRNGEMLCERPLTTPSTQNTRANSPRKRRGRKNESVMAPPELPLLGVPRFKRKSPPRDQKLTRQRISRGAPRAYPRYGEAPHCPTRPG